MAKCGRMTAAGTACKVIVDRAGEPCRAHENAPVWTEEAAGAVAHKAVHRCGYKHPGLSYKPCSAKVREEGARCPVHTEEALSRARERAEQQTIDLMNREQIAKTIAAEQRVRALKIENDRAEQRAAKDRLDGAVHALLEQARQVLATAPEPTTAPDATARAVALTQLAQQIRIVREREAEKAEAAKSPAAWPSPFND
jgi:hypothetical protein